MAPSLQIVSRDTTTDNSGSNGITPIIIAGIACAGFVLLCVCLWLGVRAYKKRNRTRIITANGAISGGNEKISKPRIIVEGAPYFSRNQLTSSVILPQQNLPHDATKDEILQYYMASGTMTRPFSINTSLGGNTTVSPIKPNFSTPRPVSTVSFLSAARTPSPRRTSFFGFGGNRPSSVASSFSAVSSAFGGAQRRKIRQLFSPVLPDEFVVSLGEYVTIVQSFDDGWCIVGRDSLIKPGDVDMGAVPAWCFVKPVKGLKASRPMRTTSLGVTVEIQSGPGFSSREEVISWSNF